jgi:hypothetical protein
LLLTWSQEHRQQAAYSACQQRCKQQQQQQQQQLLVLQWSAEALAVRLFNKRQRSSSCIRKGASCVRLQSQLPA